MSKQNWNAVSVFSLEAISNGARQFSPDEARRIGDSLSIDWRHANLDQFRMGLHLELEYVARTPETNVTNDDMRLTGKIVLAHLKEFPAYYSRLATREAEADKQRVKKWTE